MRTYIYVHTFSNNVDIYYFIAIDTRNTSYETGENIQSDTIPECSDYKILATNIWI